MHEKIENQVKIVQKKYKKLEEKYKKEKKGVDKVIEETIDLIETIVKIDPFVFGTEIINNLANSMKEKLDEYKQEKNEYDTIFNEEKRENEIIKKIFFMKIKEETLRLQRYNTLKHNKIIFATFWGITAINPLFCTTTILSYPLYFLTTLQPIVTTLCKKIRFFMNYAQKNLLKQICYQIKR